MDGFSNKRFVKFGKVPAMNQQTENRSSPDQCFRFAKAFRLRYQPEFDRVHESDYYVADQMLVVKAVFNGTDVTRLGLSVNRRVGCAVVRNKWKRTIREVFRLHRSELSTGLDLVVRPRRGATCDYHRIAKSLPRLVERLNRKVQQGDRVDNQNG